MIDIKVKVHDKFSIEIKVGFVVRRKLRQNDFVINTWFFFPNSLDINQSTYEKKYFYSDVKSNIRLITPIYLLREIVSGNAVPLNSLERAFEQLASDPGKATIREYEYQIKMFAAIFKSALRDEVLHIMNNPIGDDMEYLCRNYLENVYDITHKYRDLRKIINVPTVPTDVLNYFLFGDEFMCDIIIQQTFRLINKLDALSREKFAGIIADLKKLITRETEYKRSKGYLIAQKDSPNKNRNLVFRNGVLKKYVESDLFLNAKKKRDGALVEQVYYSLAAGLSMIFATAIAFSFQQKYGNFTMPLFVALVVSYMLKDRIKELMRYYFAYKLGEKYFDNKTTISIKDIPIGWSKEGVDFITDEKVPLEVMNIRSRSSLLEAENRIHDEKILLYRKLVQINRDVLEDNSEYPISGIHDIMRLHISRFIQKTDNPNVTLYSMDDDGNVISLEGEKVYYLNMVMQLQHDNNSSYKRFRIVFNRLGIIEIEELK